MKKKTYVAPETEMRIVELEQGFMNSSVYPEDKNNEDAVHATEQEQGIDYDFANDQTFDLNN